MLPKPVANQPNGVGLKNKFSRVMLMSMGIGNLWPTVSLSVEWGKQKLLPAFYRRRSMHLRLLGRLLVTLGMACGAEWLGPASQP